MLECPCKGQSPSITERSTAKHHLAIKINSGIMRPLRFCMSVFPPCQLLNNLINLYETLYVYDGA
jgi:hypothetical protein